jgi:hypothetical protein
MNEIFFDFPEKTCNRKMRGKAFESPQKKTLSQFSENPLKQGQ